MRYVTHICGFGDFKGIAAVLTEGIIAITFLVLQAKYERLNEKLFTTIPSTFQ